MTTEIVLEWYFSVAIDEEDNPVTADLPAEEDTESRHVTLTVESSRRLLLTPTETPSDESAAPRVQATSRVPVPLRQFLTDAEDHLTAHFSRLCLILHPEALGNVAGKTRQAIIESAARRDVRLRVKFWVNALMPSPEAIRRHIIIYTATVVLNNDAPAEVPAAKPLEYVSWDETTGDGEEEELCPICLEELRDIPKDDRRVVRTPCSHLYHERCIGRWLKMSCKCPLCRYEMPKQKLPIMVSFMV